MRSAQELQSNLYPMSSVKAMILFKNNGEHAFSFLNRNGQRRSFVGIIPGDPPLLRIKPADKYLETVEHKIRLDDLRHYLNEISHIAQLAVVDQAEFDRMLELTISYHKSVIDGAPAKLTPAFNLNGRSPRVRTKKLKMPRPKAPMQNVPVEKIQLSAAMIAHRARYRALHPEKFDNDGNRIPDYKPLVI